MRFLTSLSTRIFPSHPRGLFYLSLTEIWERFSYYTMAHLLILYIVAQAPQGLGWTHAEALYFVGYYTFGIYAFPLLASYFSDKYLGRKNAAVLGGCFMLMGHILMAFCENLSLFFTALCFLILGNGFFKPSMISLVGNLYSPADKRRDAGYSFYYMAINLGSVFANFLGGIVSENFGFHPTFAMAGVGMLIAMVVFRAGRAHIHNHAFAPAHKDLAAQFQTLLEPVEEPPQITEAAPALSRRERRSNMIVLWSCYLFVFVWTLSYQLMQGGTLTLYVREFTNRYVLGYSVPILWFTMLNPLLILLLTPLIVLVLERLLKNRIHTLSKMTFGLLCCTIAFGFLTYISQDVTKLTVPTPIISPFSIVFFMFWGTLGELFVSPVMYSLISQLAPRQHLALFQALNLIMIGFAGIVASRIGAYAIALNPTQAFFGVSVFMMVLTFVLFFVRKYFIRITQGHLT